MGLSSSLMGAGCSKAMPPVVCGLKDFIQYTCKTTQKPILGPDNRPIKGPDGKPIGYIKTNDWSLVDWNAIGDGDNFDKDKFSSEMDKASFKGGMDNNKIFKTSGLNNFKGVMGEAEKVFEAAAAKLAGAGLPKSNGFSAGALDALGIHADARRADQAILIVKAFSDWATTKGITPVLGAGITRPGVPTYQLLDATATINQNGLTGDNANEVRDFVKTQNAAGESPTHVEAISTAKTLKTKLAKACAP